MAKSLNLEMVNCVLLVLVLTVLVVCCIKKSKETLTNYHYLSNNSCKNCSMCKKGKGCNCSNCQ